VPEDKAFGAAVTAARPKIVPVAIPLRARNNLPAAKFPSGEVINGFAGHGAVSGCFNRKVPLK
jgi:hypothetical protein